MTFTYTRKISDGKLRFTFEHAGGDASAVLWLVVEEIVDNPRDSGVQPSPTGPSGFEYRPPDSKYFRTGVPLSFVGEELAVPAAYFTHQEACRKAWEHLMGQIHGKRFIPPAEDGPPIPDPTVDSSLADYAARLTRFMGGG